MKIFTNFQLQFRLLHRFLKINPLKFLILIILPAFVTAQVLLFVSGNRDDEKAGDEPQSTHTRGNKSGVSGYTECNFDVSETGSASMQVPIFVSPGTGGMEPELSINYSSQGRNGILGLGWTLGGLSTISRCPATIAQDGFIDGIDFDQSDRFSLDGERLMVILGGTYGANNAEYRTEQNLFNRIKSFGNVGGGPQYYKMWTKSGLIYEYGNTVDSRIEAQGKYGIMYWAVNKITDTKGNYIKFQYQKDTANGEYRPYQIDYTANDAKGLAPYCSVRFVYETRKDTLSGYTDGSLQKVTQRLKQIRSYYKNYLVRNYNFYYQYAANDLQSQLVEIEECGSDGNCHSQPLLFDWQQSSTTSFTTQTNPLPTSEITSNSLLYFGDWNGDAVTDFMVYNQSTGANKWFINKGNFTYSSVVNPITTSEIDNGMGLFFGDWDADGITDVMWFDKDNGYNNWYINNGQLGFTNKALNLIPPGDIDGGSTIYFGDWNGDGFSDVLWYKISTGENRWYTNQKNFSFAYNSNYITNSQIKDGDGLNIGDWNRDGISDVMWYNKTNGNNFWYLNNGSLSFTTLLNPITASEIDGGKGIFLGDWNADNITDLMWWNDSDGTNTWFINKGSFSFKKVTNPIPTTGLTGGTAILHSDFTGDGISDVIWYKKENGYNTWFENKGYLNFTQYTNLITPSLIDNGTTISLGHWNKDEQTDLMWYDNTNGSNVWFSNQTQNNRFITKITNGHGAETIINYKLLTDTSVYLKEDTAAYPKVDFIGHLYVVSDFKVTNGKGGYNAMYYKYFGGKVDAEGRGFRGFSKTIVTDQRSGLRTTNYYERDYKYISSKLKKSEQRLANGTLIQEVENFMGLKKYYDWKVHYSYVEKSVTKNYELDGSLIKTTTTTSSYDDYGNPLTIVINYGDGHVDSTVNHYKNQYNEWILARLDSAKLYRKAPGQPFQCRSTAFEYDLVSGLLKKEIVEPGNDTLQLTKVYYHDDFGNILKTETTGWNGTTSETRAQQTIFDSKGRFSYKSINHLGHAENRVFDSLTGNMLSQTGPNLLTTAWQYDGFGRKTKEIRSDGTETILQFRFCDGTYSAPGALYYTLTQSSGTTPEITYYNITNDVIRKQATGFSGQKVLSDQVYNIRGQVVLSSDPYFEGETINWSEAVYDTLGRVVKQIAPGNRISTTLYQGLTITVNNPLGQRNTKIDDAVGNMLESRDHFGNSIFYTYDGFGNLVKMMDEAGHITLLTFDIRGNKRSLSDPDMGLSRYRYNAFGEMISQTNANGQVSTFQYDALGRMTRRVEPEGTTLWLYDTQPWGIGKLSSVTGPGGISEFYTYDSKGRLSEKKVQTGQELFITSNTYDEFSRVKTLTYPTGFIVRNIYNQYGYHSEVRRNNDNYLYWKATFINARGQIGQYELGNGLLTTKIYDPVTGFINSIQTTGNDTIQMLNFQFNALGNLTQRADLQRNLTENFIYDTLSRLTSASVVNGINTSMEYDIYGNITYKSDVGYYHYGENGAGPHQVTSISFADTTVCIPSLLSDLEYSSFQKVTSVTEGINRLEVVYGPDYTRRIQRTYKGDELKQTRYYFENIYEKEIRGSDTREVHYIRAGTGVIAVNTRINGSTENLAYWHKDHLGSVESITGETGQLLEALSYDAWGKRRNADTWAPLENPGEHISDRGFTGHEHLDLFNLINMNGRVYDPVIGRFISPDPFVQSPENLMGLNRYVYCMNNPLSLVDPSGYGWFSKLWKQIWKPLVTIVAGILTAGIAVAVIGGVSLTTAFSAIFSIGGWSLTTAGAIVSGAGMGFGAAFAGTLLAGGDVGDAFKAGIIGGVIGGITGGLTKGIGDMWEHETTFQNFAIKSILHGSVQGVASVAQGGKFEHGFYAAAFSVTASPILDKILPSNKFLQLTARAIVGGSASKLGGGKFANGAVTASFVYMLNDLGETAARYKSQTAGSIERGLDFAKNKLKITQHYIDRISFAGQAANVASYGLSLYDFWQNAKSVAYQEIGWGKYMYRQSVIIASVCVSPINPNLGLGISITGQLFEDSFDYAILPTLRNIHQQFYNFEQNLMKGGDPMSDFY